MTIQAKQLHPTFAAELSGVDLKNNLSDEDFKEIKRLLHIL